SGKPVSPTDENQACRICEELPIDLLLTGHQHIALAGGEWAGTHVVQTPCNARQYVKVEMDDEGRFTSALVTPGAEQTWTALESEVRQDLEDWLDRPIGHLSRDIWPDERLDMALHGTPIADFFNRVQLWASGADLSLTMLPNDIRGFAKDVTVRDVVATYVYSNTLCVLKATGKDLRAAMEQTASYFDVDSQGQIRISDAFLKPKEAHYNYDFFAGVDYAFDLSRPVGERVVRLERHGEPVKDTDCFTICMCDYRATGAGEYPMWAACSHVQDILTEVSEFILRYLKEYPQIAISDPTMPLCLMNGRPC
ncbi:MAG: bifunctional metallophosphatase/5'-nucleotidase, partial [Clostridia bacterium]|nr:bifunctional metallophosphatase/5'-nucleotidase [Clostridia bacterium]